MSEYKKNTFIDIGTMKAKVAEDIAAGILVQVTHNGYQWSGLNVANEAELRVLWQTIGRYLKEDL